MDEDGSAGLLKSRLFFKNRDQASAEEILAKIGADDMPKDLTCPMDSVVSSLALMTKLMKEKETKCGEKEEGSASDVGLSTSIQFVGALRGKMAAKRKTAAGERLPLWLVKGIPTSTRLEPSHINLSMLYNKQKFFFSDFLVSYFPRRTNRD